MENGRCGSGCGGGCGAMMKSGGCGGCGRGCGGGCGSFLKSNENTASNSCAKEHQNEEPSHVNEGVVA